MTIVTQRQCWDLAACDCSDSRWIFQLYMIESAAWLWLMARNQALRNLHIESSKRKLLLLEPISHVISFHWSAPMLRRDKEKEYTVTLISEVRHTPFTCAWCCQYGMLLAVFSCLSYCLAFAQWYFLKSIDKDNFATTLTIIFPSNEYLLRFLCYGL